MHPLGLALEIKIDDDKSYSFGRLWDTDDKEGIVFDDEGSLDGIMKYMAYEVRREVTDRQITRNAALGYTTQPAPRDSIQRIQLALCAVCKKPIDGHQFPVHDACEDEPNDKLCEDKGILDAPKDTPNVDVEGYCSDCIEIQADCGRHG